MHEDVPWSSFEESGDGDMVMREKEEGEGGKKEEGDEGKTRRGKKKREGGG